MKIKLLSLLLSTSFLLASELHIKADSFNADENKGISIFEGNVNVIKDADELNASKVTIYTNQKNQPTKFIAIGDVSFTIETEQKTLYKGKAQKVIYLPLKKEYRFFTQVHLKQINDKKEIIGDEVVLKTIEGKAYAKGINKEPVIMIFNLADDNTTQGQQ